MIPRTIVRQQLAEMVKKNNQTAVEADLFFLRFMAVGVGRDEDDDEVREFIYEEARRRLDEVNLNRYPMPVIAAIPKKVTSQKTKAKVVAGIPKPFMTIWDHIREQNNNTKRR